MPYLSCIYSFDVCMKINYGALQLFAELDQTKMIEDLIRCMCTHRSQLFTPVLCSPDGDDGLWMCVAQMDIFKCRKG